MNIILFGHKNAGKTTLGKALSKYLGLSFVDTDEEIESLYLKKEGLSLTYKEIYAKHQKAYFRSLEKEAILGLENKVQNSIIALGGGSLLDLETRSFIQRFGCLFYLKISREEFIKRALYNKNDADIAFLEKTHEERSLIFESLNAHSIVSLSTNNQIKEIIDVIK